MNVPISAVFLMLQTALGSAYVNDFNKFGRTYRAFLQADEPYRDEADDVRRLKVRTDQEMRGSLGILANVKEAFGPQIFRRFNRFPTATIAGSAVQGVSSDQALNILVVPLGLLGVVAFIAWFGIDNNTYVQIGVVLITPSRQQACNSDCRVRKRAEAGAEGHHLVGRSSGTSTLSSDPDDFLSVYLGRTSLSVCHGSRRSQSTCARHCSVRWYGHLHVACDILCASVLCGVSMAERTIGVSQTTCGQTSRSC